MFALSVRNYFIMFLATKPQISVPSKTVQASAISLSVWMIPRLHSMKVGYQDIPPHDELFVEPVGESHRQQEIDH